MRYCNRCAPTASCRAATLTMTVRSTRRIGPTRGRSRARSHREQLIHDVYYALREAPGWTSTLLIITYDEHGGCFDHVPPPSGVIPPDDTVGEFGFDFRRFGVRVPTVLLSPLIREGTVFRVDPGATPQDHTSILKTVEERWGLAPLTAREAATQGVGRYLHCQRRAWTTRLRA